MIRLSYWRDERAVSAAEYGLILALVAIVIIGGLGALRVAETSVLHKTQNDVENYDTNAVSY